MTKGIYEIKNIVSGKNYIGSSINIEERWIQHKSRLRRNRHENIYLQRSWNKYGEESFELRTIYLIDATNSLLFYEQWFLDVLFPEYNIAKNSTAPMLGKHHTEEAKAKMSRNQTGKRNSFYGKHHTKEHNERRKKLYSGKNNGMYGRQHTDEAKAIISKANAKLFKDEVLEIRRLYATGKITQTLLGKIFDISTPTISMIVNRKRWQQI